MTTTATRFWDRIAARYAARPIADQAAYEEKLRLTRAQLTPEMRVLELGCGTGGTAIAHAPHVAHVDATDLSAEMIRIARTRAEAAGATNVSFKVEAVEDLDPPDSPYDAVLALNLLHLVDDLDGALERIRNVLKPGGRLIASTAVIGETMPWFAWIAPLGRAVGLIPPVRSFDSACLRAALARAGFAVTHESRPGARHVVFHIAHTPPAVPFRAAA